jgi:beta-galactosidase
MPIYPIGAHLCRDPMPAMAEMLHDLEVMKDLGFTLVKIQVNWATTEAVRGSLDLDRYHQLIHRAGELGLQVYIGFICEHAPAWLYREHPDCRMETRLGGTMAYQAVSTMPGDGKPGPCFDHAAANGAMLDWLRRITAELAVHAHIGWWNTWQEIQWWAQQGWLAGDDTCYCEHTLAAFRAMLRREFGTIEALNRSWRSFHAAFDDIVPTRTQRGHDGQPVDLAWMDFQLNRNIARTLRERAEAIRAADPRRRPVFAHKAACDIGAGADRHYGHAQDFLGFSAYCSWYPFHGWDDGRPQPGHRLRKEDALTAEVWNAVALAADHTRACTRDGQAWSAEQQGGPISPNMHRGRTPDAADIRRWLLLGLGHGVTGTSFWVFREEVNAAELDGFGLLDGEGDHSERAAEAGRIARAVQPWADLFAAPAQVMAEVAILIDDRNARSQRTNTNAEGHLAYDVRGLHRLLFDLGIAVDFLHAEDLAARGARYRTIIHPLPICLGDDVAARLKTWVEAGGQLIAEACPGRIDADNYAVRGGSSPLVRALFGARYDHFRLVREPGGQQRWSLGERTWDDLVEPEPLVGSGPLEGVRLVPQWLLSPLIPEGAQPVLVGADGRIHGTRHALGRGAAWQIGTVIGFRGTADRSPEGHAAVRALLAATGIRPVHTGHLVVRRRIQGAREAWCVYNPTPEPVSERIAWPEDCGRIVDLLDGPLADRHVLTVAPLDCRILILER